MEDLTNYKLAVKQAEAAYGILAAHPLFFYHAAEQEARVFGGLVA